MFITEYVECFSCKKPQENPLFKYDKEKREEIIKRHKDGELIQNIVPELSPGERDILIIGICDECFDNLFKPKDEPQ